MHPVLIRNEHNSLIQVVVVATQPGMHATRFTFSLRDTDDRNDIDSLRLYYSGDKRPEGLDQIRSGINFLGDRQAIWAELAGKPLGALAAPSTVLTFDGDQVLRKGTNVFWLSCTLRAGASLSHKVDARCTAIATSEGKVTPRDATPGVRKRIGFSLRKHYDDGVHTSRIPALVEDRRIGRVLLAMPSLSSLTWSGA